MDRRLLIAILLSLSFLSMYGAHRVNNWNGEIKVTNVVIPGENTVSGVLYEPNEITGQTTGVLLSHGISNSKEPFSGAALELAKHGYVALSIDLFGHGRSSGSLDTGDPSLGVVQAARFLADLPYVADEIGLIGHSLGAGVSNIASINVSEAGLVLIGGGIGQNPYSILDEMNQPSNVLVIIGRYDVLFNLDTIEEELEASFPNPPVFNQLKGDSEEGTMTMLLIPATTHLFEPVYPETVDATIEWFKAITDYAGDYPQTYLARELLIALALVFFIASIIVSFTIDAVMVEPQGMDRLSGVVYGLVGFLIFLPAMLLGNILPFPPQVFGSSIAWWLMIWGIVMYLVTVIWRREKIELSIRRGDVAYALMVFVAGYIFCSGLEYVFGFGFRLLVPIMRMLTLKRAGSFLIYIPFMFIHFHSESNWFKTQTSSIQGLIASKLGIFTAIILAQYGGFYLLNIVLVGGFVGFILEFLVAIVPMLLISGLFAAYAQRYNRLGASVILNALLFSWIAAGLFPY